MKARIGFNSDGDMRITLVAKSDRDRDRISKERKSGGHAIADLTPIMVGSTDGVITDVTYELRFGPTPHVRTAIEALQRLYGLVCEGRHDVEDAFFERMAYAIYELTQEAEG